MRSPRKNNAESIQARRDAIRGTVGDRPLALEISASSAMATAGSENFFKAHHERGGLR